MSAKAPALSRKQALEARPARLPLIGSEEGSEGALKLTVELVRPRWQKALGASRTFEKTYELDAVGRSVYEACNGKRTVAEIARRFARDRKVSVPEAQLAVAAYMKTLIAKGLVGMKLTGGRGQ